MGSLCPKVQLITFLYNILTEKVPLFYIPSIEKRCRFHILSLIQGLGEFLKVNQTQYAGEGCIIVLNTRCIFTEPTLFAGNVSQDFSHLDALDLDDVLELLESTQDSLDEIWKQEDHKPYPEARMKHLLDVMAGALGRYVQRKLGMLDIWHDSFQQVKDAMRKGITVCERWVSTCGETLTSQYWKRFLPHPWRGEKFVPENLSQLAARLEEVTYMYKYMCTFIDLFSTYK